MNEFWIEGGAAGQGAVKLSVFASIDLFACFCHTKFWSWSIPWSFYAIADCRCRKYLWLEHRHGKQVAHRHTETTTKKIQRTSFQVWCLPPYVFSKIHLDKLLSLISCKLKKESVNILYHFSLPSSYCYCGLMKLRKGTELWSLQWGWTPIQTGMLDVCYKSLCPPPELASGKRKEHVECWIVPWLC